MKPLYKLQKRKEINMVKPICTMLNLLNLFFNIQELIKNASQFFSFVLNIFTEYPHHVS